MLQESSYTMFDRNMVYGQKLFHKRKNVCYVKITSKKKNLYTYFYSFKRNVSRL